MEYRSYGVRDDKDVGVGCGVGCCLGQVSDNASICVEEVFVVVSICLKLFSSSTHHLESCPAFEEHQLG